VIKLVNSYIPVETESKYEFVLLLIWERFLPASHRVKFKAMPTAEYQNIGIVPTGPN